MTGVVLGEEGVLVEGGGLELLCLGVEVENLGDDFGLSFELSFTALDVLGGSETEGTK